LYLKDSVVIWKLLAIIHPAAIQGRKRHYYRDVDELINGFLLQLSMNNIILLKSSGVSSSIIVHSIVRQLRELGSLP
jgi:hypothetical protein